MVLSSYLLTSVYKITNDQWLTIILCSGHWLFWGHEEGTEDAAWRTWPGRPLHDRQLRWKEAQDKGGFRGNAEKNPFLSFFSVSTSIVSKQMATPCRKDVRNCVIWTQISLMFIIPNPFFPGYVQDLYPWVGPGAEHWGSDAQYVWTTHAPIDGQVSFFLLKFVPLHNPIELRPFFVLQLIFSSVV